MSDETVTNLRKETGYDPDSEGSVDDLIAYKDALEDIVYGIKDDTYNGWKNYETWAVGMYLDGNYDGAGIYYAATEAVRETLEDLEHPTSEYWSVEESKRYNVADRLKDLVEEYINPSMVDDDHPDPELHPLVADLLGASLSSVDWYELADAWIESLSEE